MFSVTWRRDEGPRPEGPRAGMGLLGRGSEPPPHQLGVWGSAVISPSRVRENLKFAAT